MADVKISQLPVATTPLDGTEVLPIVQSATTKQVSIANVTAGRAVSALSLSLTNALPVTSGGTGIATAAQGSLLSATGADTFSATRTPTLGLAGTAAGTLGLSGVTSGVVTLATAAAAGTWTFTLPTTGGTNNYLLKTDGSGNTDWVNPTALGIDLDVGTTAITNGTAGRVFFQGSGDVLQQSANLFWDNTNSRLGIGTATPAGPLQIGATPSLLLDTSGNLGLGVTPSASWQSTRRVVQVGSNAALWGINSGTGTLFLSNNTYYDGPDFRYLNTGNAAYYSQAGAGSHAWFTAASGTAGNAISFTQAMTLDASGNLGLGVTPSAWGTNKALEVGVVGNAINGFGAANTSYTAGAYLPSGGGWTYAVSGVAVSRYTQFGGNHGWFTAPSGIAGNAISFTQAMTLDASGNLGIGTTSPANFGGVNLQVQNSNIGSIIWSNGTHVGQLLASAAAEVSIGSRSNSPLRFGTNDTERARIDSSGRLLFNTTSTFDTVTLVQINASTGAQAGLSIKAGTTDFCATFYAYNNATLGGSIKTSGTTTAYNTSSDVKLKENIADAASALASILSMPIRQFDWKADGLHTDYGVVAQEAYECAPEMVSQGELWGVDYGRITPRLIKAFQELAEKVSALEAKQ